MAEPTCSDRVRELLLAALPPTPLRRLRSNARPAAAREVLHAPPLARGSHLLCCDELLHRPADRLHVAPHAGGDLLTARARVRLDVREQSVGVDLGGGAARWAAGLPSRFATRLPPSTSGRAA